MEMRYDPYLTRRTIARFLELYNDLSLPFQSEIDDDGEVVTEEEKGDNSKKAVARVGSKTRAGKNLILILNR